MNKDNSTTALAMTRWYRDIAYQEILGDVSHICGKEVFVLWQHRITFFSLIYWGSPVLPLKVGAHKKFHWLQLFVSIIRESA